VSEDIPEVKTFYWHFEDAAEIVGRGRAVDAEAQLRQLERDVALDARLDDATHRSYERLPAFDLTASTSARLKKSPA
jgi:hypothetical protein